MDDFRTFLKATFAAGTKAAKGASKGVDFASGIIDIGNSAIESSQRNREYSQAKEEKIDQLNIDLDLLEEIDELEKRLKKMGMTLEQAQEKLVKYFGDTKE